MVAEPPLPREAVVQSLSAYERLITFSKQVDPVVRRDFLDAAFEIRGMAAHAKDEDLERWLQMLSSCEQGFTDGDFGPSGLSQGSAHSLLNCVREIIEEAKGQ